MVGTPKYTTAQIIIVCELHRLGHKDLAIRDHPAIKASDPRKKWVTQNIRYIIRTFKHSLNELKAAHCQDRGLPPGSNVIKDILGNLHEHGAKWSHHRQTVTTSRGSNYLGAFPSAKDGVNVPEQEVPRAPEEEVIQLANNFWQQEVPARNPFSGASGVQLNGPPLPTAQHSNYWQPKVEGLPLPEIPSGCLLPESSNDWTPKGEDLPLPEIPFSCLLPTTSSTAQQLPQFPSSIKPEVPPTQQPQRIKRKRPHPSEIEVRVYEPKIKPRTHRMAPMGVLTLPGEVNRD